MLDNFYYKKDRLNQLRGFCATVQTNSIIKASKIVGVEPTAVSKQISGLERELQVELFDRNIRKNRLVLTEFGKEFYNKAVVVMQQFDGLFTYYKNNKFEENIKEVRIASHHTGINYLLPIYIDLFKKKYKKEFEETKFNLYNLKIKESLDMLRNDEIDLIFHTTTDIDPSFNVECIFEFEPILLMSKNNKLAKKNDIKITFGDISESSLITIDVDNVTSYYASFFENNSVNSNISLTNGDWESVRNFVKLDLGIHIYSNIYNKLEVFQDPDLTTKNVKHLFPNIKFQLITKKGRMLPRNARLFLDIIRDNDFKTTL